MRSNHLIASALLVLLSSAAQATSFLPTHQGTQPLQSRLVEIRVEAEQLASQYSDGITNTDKRNAIGQKLVALRSERLALENELAGAKQLGSSPLINF